MGYNPSGHYPDGYFPEGHFPEAAAGGTDDVPDAFTFTDQTGVPTSSIIESNLITITGIDTASAWSITGGEASINGGAYSSAGGTVDNGDTIRVRHTSSASASTATNTVLTVGGVSDTFTSTTAAASSPGQGALLQLARRRGRR
ncbi:MAG TPA: hypothetical protein VNI78_02265 [Vicinamibacterales bacterium]|nr:hypothetical protein [Vicinamibacterales bacterium]